MNADERRYPLPAETSARMRLSLLNSLLSKFQLGLHHLSDLSMTGVGVCYDGSICSCFCYFTEVAAFTSSGWAHFVSWNRFVDQQCAVVVVKTYLAGAEF